MEGIRWTDSMSNEQVLTIIIQNLAIGRTSYDDDPEKIGRTR